MATVLTNDGQEWAAERLAGVQGAGTNNVYANAGSHIGWGTGSGTASASDTTLFTESSDPASRASTTVSVVGTGSSAKYQATATLTSSTSQTITNAGLFTASSSGVLLVKGDFTGIALANGDSISFTLTIDPS